MIFSTEKQLKEYGDKIPADKKAPIESALDKLKTAYSSKDITSIDSAQEELNTAWAAASEDMYKASADGQPGAQPGADANAQQGGDTVTDVDFEEVK